MHIRPPKLPDDLQHLIDIRNGCLAMTEDNAPSELWSTASLERYLSYPMVNPEEDLLILVASDRVAGFALMARSRLRGESGGPVMELWELWVNPYMEMDRLGRALLEAARVTACRREAEVLRTTWIPQAWIWIRELYTAMEFRAARRFVTMQHPGPALSPAAADGFELTRSDTSDAGQITELVTLYDTTFARNWGVEPQTEETIPYQLRTSAVEGGGAGYVLARADGKTAGFLMSYLDPGSRAWVVDAVGVDEEARGQGLGRALVAWAMAQAADANATGVQISVDTQNEPALGLYRSMGYTDLKTHDVYERVL